MGPGGSFETEAWPRQWEAVWGPEVGALLRSEKVSESPESELTSAEVCRPVSGAGGDSLRSSHRSNHRNIEDQPLD